jgi:hypothetical protein
MDKPTEQGEVTTHVEGDKSGPVTVIKGRVQTILQENITGSPLWKRIYSRLPALKKAPRAGWRRSKH